MDVAFRESSSNDSPVEFSINGKTYTVRPNVDNVDPNQRLVDFIRDTAGWKGTKVMCREGGCGACVVTVRTLDPATGDTVIKPLNSCLAPVLSCDGYEITTVEHLGNVKDGYDPIQNQMVEYGGTQCGFCSSGMVMNMYSLREGKVIRGRSLKPKSIEGCFDGNICRCTGYRPIMDAFKSLPNVIDEGQSKCSSSADIEDGVAKCLAKNTENFLQTYTARDKVLQLASGKNWTKATSIEKVFEAINAFTTAGQNVRLVAGNTATGVYKEDFGMSTAYVDIRDVPELQLTDTTDMQSIKLGGGVTLTKAIKFLKNLSATEGFAYAAEISKHIKRIANFPVRSVATLAGNLMVKHTHKEFPSDLFTIFETVGAKLSIASSTTSNAMYSFGEFQNLNMQDKLILAIVLKPASTQHIFRSFKITRRYQNSHAYVNAGFMFKVDIQNGFKVLEKPNIVFGGISSTFVHATRTENALVGKSLTDASTIQQACALLNEEVQPEYKPEDGSVNYRKELTKSLLYKFVLGVIGTSAKPIFQLGGQNLQRNQISGKQIYDTDRSMWPVNKPVKKLESQAQVSGAAEYINDIYTGQMELFGAFVLSTVAKGDIVDIDPSEAFKLPGVVRFIKASDIPGINNYMVFNATPDEIFAHEKVQYHGQAVGLILADSEQVAFEAAKKVKIEYGNVQKGLFCIKDGIKLAEETQTYTKLFSEDVIFSKETDQKPTKVIKGEFGVGSQYHFQMETQITTCIPKEDGLDVYSATQWIDLTQAAIASAINIPHNEINIQVRRLGGAFGSKISRATQIATACAVAAHLTNRPVKVSLDLETNMAMMGKRPPYLMKYEMGVDDKGKILSLEGKIFCDTGISTNEETAMAGISFFQSMYQAVGWKLSPANILTNTAPNTWCRAPGSVPGIAMVENLMEHIAFELNLDPTQVRLANLLEVGDKVLTERGVEEELNGEILITRMIDELKTSGHYDSRVKYINEFNKTNRWRKRGISLVPMRYPLDYYGNTDFPVYIAVYHTDATVIISHSGIECGQGINTKVAQVVSLELEIPMEKIRVKSTHNWITPNSSTTGGSITSELCCFAAQEACKKLKKRMEPIKQKYKPKSWESLVKLCYKNAISLSASYLPGPRDELHSYHIWVANLTEVEIDVLTGEYKIVRVDIIEDAGKSLNPAVDVGQVEGALVMGIGYWTTEKIIYDSETGRLLSNNTWLYKPPLPRDIPEDLRVTLLRNAPNPVGILRSKATGEPPQCSAVAVLFALKNAIYEARKDAGHSEWFQLDGPVTVEDVMIKCLNSVDQFSI